VSTLVTLVLFGILSALFANQNTGTATLHLGYITLANIPLYLIILGSMLFGLLMAWVINIIESVLVSFQIMGKNRAIKATQQEVDELSKKLQEVEIENARLKGEDTMIVKKTIEDQTALS